MMAEPSGNLKCAITCWLTGLLVGILAIVLLRLIGDFSWPGAVFTGGVLFVALGALLSLILCRPLPTLAEVQARHPNAAQRASSGGSVAPATAPAAAPASATPAPTATAAPAAPPPAAEVAPAPAPEPEPEPEPEPAPEPAPAPAAQSHGANGAATSEDAGTKPDLLNAPRDGGADNLKEIKGVGPKLEKLLNSMGVYHFDQVASWSADEIAWVDANLEGFKGRVSRDNWVDQAKLLASGGETEFSKRVEGGDVY